VGDALEFSRNLIRTAGYSVEGNPIAGNIKNAFDIIPGPAEVNIFPQSTHYPQTLSYIFVSTDQNVGITPDDGSASLTQDCRMVVVSGKTITANSDINGQLYTIDKDGPGTFNLSTNKIVDGHLRISGGIVEVGTSVTPLDGILSLRPSGKLVVKGSTTIGEINLLPSLPAFLNPV
jgi:hypothetical protein